MAGSGPQGEAASKMEESPDELRHITTDIMPLSILVTRLAEYSHAKLQEVITELAAKPLPSNLVNGNANGTTNGNGVVHIAAVEDTSPESLDKKTMLLNFTKDLHSRWVKALVITEWSRNADEVGKLIDIRTHIAEKLELYNKTFWDMVQVKRDMLFARVPSPDLTTALEVLSNGAVHWMPDFGYLEPPALSEEEKVRWIHDIEMNLQARLQLQEYDTMPEPFKSYKIDKGRVIFTVPGEFEVDLTIGDEDFSSQLWFLDYRPRYSPAPLELSQQLRQVIENRTNSVLATDGLTGCYRYLHEFTLTAKIAEFTRQAVELSKSGNWIGTLSIERLNRALGIQYWTNRLHSRGSQSWILLGVRSGTVSGEAQDPLAPGSLMLSWFRDGKQVKDIDISFNADVISIESLLMSVIAKHIEHLLSPMCKTLLAKPRYAHREGRLGMSLERAPEDLQLSLQLVGEVDATVSVSPWTGDFLLTPRSLYMFEALKKFRALPNPAEEGASVLEQLRWLYTVHHLKSLRTLADWLFLRAAPVPFDEVKKMVSHTPSPREAFHTLWMRNTKWKPQWFAVLSLSPGGDHCWMAEISPEMQGAPGRRIITFKPLPTVPSDLDHPDILLQRIATHAPDIMARVQSARNTLAGAPLPDPLSASFGNSIFPDMNMIKKPMAMARASDMLLSPRSGSQGGDRSVWAQEFIPIWYKGPAPQPVTATGEPLQRREPLRILIEAKVAVKDRARFGFLQRRLDRDVFYDPRIGQFTLRLRPEVDDPVIPVVRSRIQALDRLFEFVEATRRAGKRVALESVTLREIVFTYGAHRQATSLPSSPSESEQRPWKVRLELATPEGVNVRLEQGNPHLRIIDYLRETANSPKSKSLPAYLSLTLPLYRGLERLQDAWDIPSASKQGECYIFHKKLDWVTLRFGLPGSKLRRAQLDIKARERKGELMWLITRSAADPNASNENDEFTKALAQNVWSTNGDGFKGLWTGAAANWDRGIENLLTLVSNTLLSLVGTPPPPYLQLQQQQQQSQQLQQQQQQHASPGGHGQEQKPIPPQGAAGRFPQQLPQNPQHHQHPQQQRLPQHLAQPGMHGQALHQGQPQGQRPGLGQNNASVVVID